MELKDKINALSIKFAVTEEQLIEAYYLGIPTGIDENEFLCYHAIMADTLRLSAKEIQNFLYHFIMNIDFTNGGFIMTIYRLFHAVNRGKGVRYLIDSIGTYDLPKIVTLLDRIDEIEEFSYKLV